MIWGREIIGLAHQQRRMWISGLQTYRSACFAERPVAATCVGVRCSRSAVHLGKVVSGVRPELGAEADVL